MKSILRKQESYVTDNINRDVDQPKSTIANIVVNVGNSNVTGLGEDINKKMGDVAVDKGGDDKTEKSYRDTIKQDKRVNFRFIENSSSADGVDVMLSKESVKKGHIHDKVVNLRKELEDTQTLIESDPHDGGLREKEAKYLKEFVEASMDEERFVKQKAKVKWLAEGDANTKYFHNILKCKNNKKTILSVLGVDGMVLEGDLMIHEFVNFYEHFLGGEHDSPTLPSMDLFSKRLDMEGGTGADAVQYFFSLECD
ncbi:hypothetical protein QVD17_19849 [Tagetes erecta]|uniref:RNA-directed DNA polymerase, eukaryota, reverse transcriptase zinc-binding domain protein n=1 Tax=Tagetes erecta TaxID=13708 RepID=A0AAD8NXK7_TARER|nr:hypothetical protein QVD17_19849 [Tagetes erecta]